MLVRADAGISFAYLLRTIKNDVDLTKTGEDVAKVRKTKKGDLLLAVREDKNMNASDVLKKVTKVWVEGVKVESLRRSMTIHISGIDDITTEAEIVESLDEVLPQEDRDCARIL